MTRQRSWNHVQATPIIVWIRQWSNVQSISAMAMQTCSAGVNTHVSNTEADALAWYAYVYVYIYVYIYILVRTRH